MTRPRRLLPAAPALTVIALAVAPAPAAAIAGSPGGLQAPPPSRTGGAVSASTSLTVLARPVLSRLSIPASAPAGSPPRIVLRIDEAGVGTVYARVNVIDQSTHRPAVSALLGWVRTGRSVSVRWPPGASLVPGSYQVSVSAHDHHGGQLLRQAHSSGAASLVIVAPPTTAPAPVVVPPASPVTLPVEAGVPTPAQSVAAGAVFPVAGPHSFGGPENRFGAPRGTHTHQGQDVLSAEGTPVVAPLAGTIAWTSYQEGGAGYYAVEHTSVGLDFMFAHCQAASLAVSVGEAVVAGQTLCRVGQSGDATTPHLHFEMWVGGWQAASGHPIDPLPYLEAWERPAGG
jgi:murein DD-endopeptidase MepM/ murein hydrolase activator NlpD